MRFNRFWRYRRILLSKQFMASLLRSRRNIVAVRMGDTPESGPFMVELDVTYLCDCRCQMCQRWRERHGGELTLGEYEKLAAIFHRMGVHLVSLAGGEPLMRKDIFPIIRSFTDRNMIVNVCTNGLLLEKNAEALCRSGASFVTVSIDGASAHTHDRVRGVSGSYCKIEKGVQAFIARRSDIRPLLRVRMTVSNQNIDEVKRFYRKWKKAADDVLLQPSHYCASAYYTGGNEAAFRLDPSRLATQLSGTSLAKDRYMKRLLRSLFMEGTFPQQRCYAGLMMVRLDPWGNVYPCLEQHVSVGSVREQNFRTIWSSDFFSSVRKEILNDGHCRCWYNNTALIGHYGRRLDRTTAQGIRHGIRNLLTGTRSNTVHP